MIRCINRALATVGLLLMFAGTQASEHAGAASAEAIFDQHCGSCHGSWLGSFFADAPRIGKREDWAALLPKGVDGLTATAIAGIGEMPPKGDCDGCTDAEVRRAVEYIVEQSR